MQHNRNSVAVRATAFISFPATPDMQKAICVQKLLQFRASTHFQHSTAGPHQSQRNNNYVKKIKSNLSIILDYPKYIVSGDEHFLVEEEKSNLIHQTKTHNPTLHIQVKPLGLNSVYQGEGHTASTRQSDRWQILCRGIPIHQKVKMSNHDVKAQH